MPQFLISLLHWSHISFPGAFFWGLQTASCHWGPDLENRVGVKAIQSAIHVVLSSLRLTSYTVYCLDERALFSSSFVAIFCWFLPSNVPIMLYNICYWWLFLSQGNWGTKYLAYPKIQRPKPCLLMFASLVALDSFHQLLSTQLMANLTLEWSGGSLFHPLSHINSKTPFCCIETVANNTLNHQHVVFDRLWANFKHNFLIDKCSCKMVNILPSDIFNSSAISCNFNLQSARMSLWSFWCFLRQLPNFSDLSVQHHLCMYNRI